MRNRILLSLLLMGTLSFVALARTVTLSEARQVANDFFGEHAPMNVPLRLKEFESAEQEVHPFYIFNSRIPGNGFVIVNGDDSGERILGYSHNGYFDVDNLPPQLANILTQYAEYADNLKSSHLTDKPHHSWATPLKISSDEGVLLETPNYGQGYPYNTLTPIIDGVHAPTGCTATAMAIVMKYHNWPTFEIGPGYYDFNLEWQERPFTVHFDWDNILQDYTNSENVTDTNIHAVSELMFEAGTAIGSQYGKKETGAYWTTLSGVFRSVFRYGCNATLWVRWKEDFEDMEVHREFYTKEEWYGLLKYELDRNNPILYSQGQHVIVVDGYDSNELFHINWGWDGIDNGYYSLSQLYDSFLNGAGSNYHDILVIYPELNRPGQESMINIQPFEGNGIFILEEIISNQPIKVEIKGLLCRNATPFEFGIALADQNRNIIEIAPETIREIPGNPVNWGDYHRWSSISFVDGVTFNTNIDNGLLLIPVYREEGGGWIDIIGWNGQNQVLVDDYLSASINDIQYDDYTNGVVIYNLQGVEIFRGDNLGEFHDTGYYIVKNGKRSRVMHLNVH